MGQRDKSSPTNMFPWKEILAFLGVVFTAYIGYLGIRSQNEIPIQATQTAEASHNDLIPSPPLSTVAWTETSLAVTAASVMAPTVQPTFVTMVATSSATWTPAGPAVSSQSIACITSQQGTGVPAEVHMDSLTYSSISSPAAQLPLANGEVILFMDMRSFEVIEVVQDPPRVRVTITLLNGDTITEDVRGATYYFDRLQGKTDRGSFSTTLSDVKRVEFRDQGGCQS